jgi:Holliday junction resolvase RusA-like endonuclease
MELTETIYGNIPSKSNCYRIGGKGLFKTSALTKYEKDFFIQCKNRNAGIADYFELTVKVFYPTQKSDLDNSLKIMLDCLQHSKVIVNDNKCVKIVAEKFLDKINPRIELTINTAL